MVLDLYEYTRGIIMCTYSRCAFMMGWVVSRDTLHVIINFNGFKIS